MFALFKNLSKITRLNGFTLSLRHCQEASNTRDVEQLFLRQDVQRILRSITGFNLDKVFSRVPVDKLQSPKYAFLTDEDLELTLRVTKRKAQQKLLMPPVLNPRDEEPQVLSKDPALQGYSDSKFIFTDISQGFTDRNRTIVVRETDGLLRRATRAERYRVNQVYFPLEERLHTTPKMFDDENLQQVLDRHEYLFVLERACLQFDPDDPFYIEVVHKTYDHIANNKKFDLLRSSRHFGPMAFYYAFNDKIDPLLQDMIGRHMIQDAADLVRLLYILQQDELKSAKDLNDMDAIKDYIKHNSHHRHYLEMSLKAHEEFMNQEKDSENEKSTEDAVAQ